MPEPWYINPNATRAMRDDFQKTAPEAFRKRNVFCSNRVFSNPHLSSREPGDFHDLRRKRLEMLTAMEPAERALISPAIIHMPEALHFVKNTWRPGLHEAEQRGWPVSLGCPSLTVKFQR
jgi:hypothetical protein